MTLACGDVTVEFPNEPAGNSTGELAGSVRVGDGPPVAVLFVTAQQYARRIADAVRSIKSDNRPVLTATAQPAFPVLVPDVTPAAIEDLIRRGAFEPLRNSPPPQGAS